LYSKKYGRNPNTSIEGYSIDGDLITDDDKSSEKFKEISSLSITDYHKVITKKYNIKSDMFLQVIARKNSLYRNMSLLKEYVNFHNSSIYSWKKSKALNKELIDGGNLWMRLAVSTFIPNLDYSKPSEMSKEKWKTCMYYY